MPLKDLIKRIPFFSLWYRIYINLFVYLIQYKNILLIRSSGLFDNEYYFRNNRNVKSLRINPIVHYFLYGGACGRNPSPFFNSKFYLAKYPEVKRQKINPLIHFISTGRLQGYMPADFDNYPSESELEKALQITRNGKNFSVIMPTWNRKKVIANAIDSVLNQSYRQFELIICDDGSTDRTGKFIRKKYRKEIRDRKIKYVETGHRGVSAARNTALQKAGGEWIAYLDSDNAWRKDYLLFVAKAYVENENIHSVYTSIKKHNQVKNKEYTLNQKFDLRLLRKDNFIDLNVYSHKKELYDRFGGFDENLNRLVDYDMILRHAESHPPLHIGFTLCDYSISYALENISLTISAEQNFDFLRKKWIKQNKNLEGQAITLSVPQEQDAEKGWKPYPAFNGRTINLEMLACHSSVLSPGKCPHSPHNHKEEEILIMLCGEVDIIIQGMEEKEQRRKLRQGQFVYYPADFKHTLENTGDVPANYLMFKWFNHAKKDGPHLPFTFIEDLNPLNYDKLKNAYTPKVNLEGRTLYCRKIQSHTSYMKPGGGYDKHIDRHDVAIIILEGEVVTNDQVAVPHDIIFYPAGILHDMYNMKDKLARYLVIEFHD